VPLIGHFHATEDTQAVRDEVFGVIADYPFRIDATIYEKRKVKPHLYDAVSFYTMAWRLHLRHLMPQITKMGEELFVISASIGTKNKRRVFGEAVTDMVSQASRGTTFRTAAWDAACEPCLQAADYCCWAIQRKWEMEDERSYVLIKDKIASEFDMFQPSGEFYY
jgi:hypothetical protein